MGYVNDKTGNWMPLSSVSSLLISQDFPFFMFIIPILFISENFLLATSERQLQILMQIYKELILDLSAKEWSTIKGIKVFEAASAAHLNWSNWANQRPTAARQKAFLDKLTCYLRRVILPRLQMQAVWRWELNNPFAMFTA